MPRGQGELSAGLQIVSSLQLTIIICGWQSIYPPPHKNGQSPGPAALEAAINVTLK